MIPLSFQNRLSIAALEFSRVERVWASTSYSLDYEGWRAAARNVDEVTAELKEAARAYEQALADNLTPEETQSETIDEESKKMMLYLTLRASRDAMVDVYGPEDILVHDQQSYMDGVFQQLSEDEQDQLMLDGPPIRYKFVNTVNVTQDDTWNKSKEPTLEVHEGVPLNKEWPCPLCGTVWVVTVDEEQGRCLNCKPITEKEAKRMHLQSIPQECPHGLIGDAIQFCALCTKETDNE